MGVEWSWGNVTIFFVLFFLSFLSHLFNFQLDMRDGRIRYYIYARYT